MSIINDAMRYIRHNTFVILDADRPLFWHARTLANEVEHLRTLLGDERAKVEALEIERGNIAIVLEWPGQEDSPLLEVVKDATFGVLLTESRASVYRLKQRVAELEGKDPS